MAAASLGFKLVKAANFVWHCHGMSLIILTVNNVRHGFLFQRYVVPTQDTQWKVVSHPNELRDNQEEDKKISLLLCQCMM